MARKIANTIADPTLPKTPIEIAGKTYFLCLDLGALAEAELYFSRQGHDVNLLLALQLNLSGVRILFPCGAHKFQPDLEFEQAQALITLENVHAVAAAVMAAWRAALPEVEAKTEPANPPQP